ncbi:19231_t:CDS:2, partial [Racocetra persica]
GGGFTNSNLAGGEFGGGNFGGGSSSGGLFLGGGEAFLGWVGGIAFP